MNAMDRVKLNLQLRKAQTALAVLDEVRCAVRELAEQEEVKFDNMCERGLEDSEIAQEIEQAQTVLEEGEAGVDEAHSALEIAIAELEGLIE